MDDEELAELLASVECPDLAAHNAVVNTSERLLISHIVTINFKSYAGRHIIGPFHKNYTAIVGPNGSGKSNVIDSLLFVFGYRAQKIRSKKISVLIHNSDEHPNLNSCTVEVHFVRGVDKYFQDDHEYDPVRGSSFHVSRTAFKDNSSHYSVDGKRVQFKEATNLLRHHGIDLDHNRFLILQGEVEQIALMKPKALLDGDEGMLEYLEDIIGSSRFIPFIDQLNKKCEEVNEIRNEKLNRVKAVEAEKNDLEGSKDEAVAYLKLENYIIKNKNILLHLNKLDEEKKCANVIEERDALKAEYKEHQKSIEEIGSQIKSRKQAYENAKKKYDECSATIDKCKVKFAEMEKEDTKLREDSKHSRKKLKELETAIEVEKKKLEDLKAQPEKSEKQVKEIREKIQDLEEKLPSLEAKLQDATVKLRDETKDLQASKENAEKDLVQYQKSVIDARSKMDIAKSELDICLSAQVNENKKLEEMQTALKKATDTTAEHRKVLPSLEENLQKNESTFRECEQKLREVTVEIVKCEEGVSKKRLVVEEARSKLQSSGKSRGQVLDAILQQKREGKIEGIIGRLGDLGAIDEKYDVAISTACGPLDNILVDTVDTAQICIEFLKKYNVGKATFLALDKQSGLIHEMRRSFQSPENVPRLFDLIRVEDETVLPAFYYALRNTLVVDNLETAKRIGYGSVRHRVVTLRGEIVETSGTMTGGGGVQRGGRMGRSVVASPSVDDISPEKLKRLDDDLAIQRSRLDDLRKRKRDLESHMDSCSREVDQLRTRIDKCRSEIDRYGDQEKNLKKQIVEQTKVVERTVPDPAEQKRLQKNVEKLTSEFEKLKPGEAKLQANIEKIHNQIMQISEKLVGTAQKLLDGCKRELDDYRKQSTKASVGAKTAARNITKTEDKIKSLQEEDEENRKKLDEVRQRLQQLETEGHSVVQVHEQAEADQPLFENDAKLAKNELTNFEEREQQLAASNMDKKQRLDHAEKTYKEYNQKRLYFEREIKKLKLNDLSDLDSIEEKPKPREDEDGNDVAPMDVDGQREKESNSTELHVPTVEELQKIDNTKLAFQLNVDENRLNNMKPNLAAIAEYRKKMDKLRDCVQQMEKVTIVRDKIRGKYDELKKRRLNEFLTGFEVISSKLKEMYQMITLGGDADLELVDTMDPFSEGVAFSVRPPKKSWKQISNLSGGEKTLSSLALVFALHHYKPTPLYVMDEIDAALDFRNVSIVANYIKERTKNAQFIIISLRSNMFELSDRLVGIYKTYNCTKSVTVDPWKITMGVPPIENPSSS